MQTGTMKMNAPTDIQPATAPRWPRIVLMVFAVINIWSALSDVTGVIMNIAENASPGLGSWLLWSVVPIRILLSAAALVFAIKGNVPRAIVALALLPLATWLTDALPAVLREGVEATIGSAGTGGLIMLLYFFAMPAMAVGAIMLARGGERLGLATFLAILPTILGTAIVVAFGVSVMIYGF